MTGVIFEPDVEKEGSPTLLGDKACSEGSVWPKSFGLHTKSQKGHARLKRRQMNRHIYAFSCTKCVRTVANSTLNSVRGTPFGLKIWEKKQAGDGAVPLAEHNGCVIRQSELDRKQAAGCDA